jgi:ribonuclease P protein component
MLPKQHRFPFRKDFDPLKKQGKLVQGPLFSLLIAPTLKSQPSRFGFIVSTKVHNRASERNRLKRLMSEGIQRILPELKPGYNVVFLVRKKAVGIGLAEIASEIRLIFKKVNLLGR